MAHGRRDPISRLQPLLQVVILAFALFCLGIAQDVFIPIALAMLLTFVLSPIVERLQRWHLPRVVAVVVTVALGVAGAVTFLGPSRDPLGALRGMDVFVHPSWAESFPYVILEAMSLARPIVASDVGGIGEALVQGESGLLTPARDERALARALAELLDDPARARSLGEEALRRSQLFSCAAMVQRMAELYEQVSARAGARRAS